MVESFKITARELKRNLKVSVILPKEYNYEEKSYPILYILDGQMLSLSDSPNQFLDAEKIIKESELPIIIVGIHAPANKDWRLSELVPFFDGSKNPNVDLTLANNFSTYIEYVLHPFIKDRYRINEQIYIAGFKESSISALYTAIHSDFYKGAGVFSPDFSICKKEIFDDLTTYNTVGKDLYFFYGDQAEDTKEADKFYKLFSTFDKNEMNHAKLGYNKDLTNDINGWNAALKEFLEFIIKK